MDEGGHFPRFIAYQSESYEPNPSQSSDPVVSRVSFQRRRDQVDQCLPVGDTSRVCHETHVICKLGLLEDRGCQKPEL